MTTFMRALAGCALLGAISLSHVQGAAADDAHAGLIKPAVASRAVVVHRSASKSAPVRFADKRDTDQPRVASVGYPYGYSYYSGYRGYYSRPYYGYYGYARPYAYPYYTYRPSYYPYAYGYPYGYGYQPYVYSYRPWYSGYNGGYYYRPGVSLYAGSGYGGCYYW